MAPALVTEEGVAVCVSPPSPPGNVSISLVAYPEQGLGQGLDTASGPGLGSDLTWCCGYFLYYPSFKASTLAPALVPSAGGTLITITTSPGLLSVDPSAVSWHCWFTLTPSDYTDPGQGLAQGQALASGPGLASVQGLIAAVGAYPVNDSLLACHTPPMLLATGGHVMVSFGSFHEIWSNVLPLSVAVSSDALFAGVGTSSAGDGTGSGTVTGGVGAGGWSLIPNRGSHRGGTFVTFYLPSSWMFVQPMVSFGNAGSTPTTPSTPTPSTPTSASQSTPTTYTAYTLTTPPGTVGQVSITIHDASYPNAPLFPLGYFSYEQPADVASISPSSAGYSLPSPGVDTSMGSGMNMGVNMGMGNGNGGYNNSVMYNNNNNNTTTIATTSGTAASGSSVQQFLVFGSFFLDTPGLSCLLGSGLAPERVAAR